MYVVVLVLYQHAAEILGNYSTWLAAFLVGKKKMTCFLPLECDVCFIVILLLVLNFARYSDASFSIWVTSYQCLNMYARMHKRIPVLTTVAPDGLAWLSHLILMCSLAIYKSWLYVPSSFSGSGARCGFSSNHIILRPELLTSLPNFSIWIWVHIRISGKNSKQHRTFFKVNFRANC